MVSTKLQACIYIGCKYGKQMSAIARLSANTAPCIPNQRYPRSQVRKLLLGLLFGYGMKLNLLLLCEWQYTCRQQ